MEDLGKAAPSLPLGIAAPIALLMFAMLMLVLWRVRDRAAWFVIFAVWLRYILDEFHAVTFKSSPIGMSWNALAAFAMVGLGLIAIRQRNLLLRIFVPVYFILIIATASGIGNDAASGFISAGLKYIYFMVIMLAVYDALDRLGGRFVPALLIAFAPPIVFQVLSVALNVTKASELDRSVSYIGGYVHEATFSVILATGLVVTCFAQRLRSGTRLGLLFVFMGAILLANYRTTILAMAPLIFVQFFSMAVTGVKPDQKLFTAIASICLLFAMLGVGASTMADRFSDIGQVVKSADTLVKAPETLTKAERNLLSGRIYIWNKYIRAYAEGPPYRYLIGFGPEVRVGGVDAKYAHNTLVSILYEYGVLGVIAILLIWATMFRMALRVRSNIRTKLIAAHVSFFLLNMSTMPMWMVQGNILYGFICGYTLYVLREERRSRRAQQEAMIATPRTMRAIPVG